MVAPVRRRLVGLLALSLALAACGGTAKPAAKSAAPVTSAAASSTSETPTPTPTPTVAVAPPAGTVLTTYTGNGQVLAATGGFTIVQSDQSSGANQTTVSTFDVAGTALTQIAGGNFTGDCGIADVSPGGRRLIITALLTNTAAQGVVAATYAESLTAFDGRTGAQVWTADIVPAQAQELTCSSGNSGDLQGFSATQDGAYGAITVKGGALQVTAGINLATGQLSPKVDLLGALGKWLVTGTQRRDYSNPDLYVLTTPPAWKGLGSFSVGSRVGLVPMEDPSQITSGRFGDSSSATGLSSDGTQLFTTQPTADNNGTVLTAYALPGMKQTWSQTSKDVTFELRGSGGNVLVVQRHASDGTTTEGLDAHTGATLWSLPLVDVCGLSTSQMIVRVNNQTAVIDLPTGKQLSYSGSSDSSFGGGSCPSLLPGGIAALQNSDGVAITQVIDP